MQEKKIKRVASSQAIGKTERKEPEAEYNKPEAFQRIKINKAAKQKHQTQAFVNYKNQKLSKSPGSKISENSDDSSDIAGPEDENKFDI